MTEFGTYQYQKSSESARQIIADEQAALAFKLSRDTLSGKDIMKVANTICDLEGVVEALELFDSVVTTAREDLGPMSIANDDDKLIEQFQQESFPRLVDGSKSIQNGDMSAEERLRFEGFRRVAGLLVKNPSTPVTS